jgi:hypothetical protein
LYFTYLTFREKNILKKEGEKKQPGPDNSDCFISPPYRKIPSEYISLIKRVTSLIALPVKIKRLFSPIHVLFVEAGAA